MKPNNPFDRNYVSPRVQKILDDLKKQDTAIRKSNYNRTANGGKKFARFNKH